MVQTTDLRVLDFFIEFIKEYNSVHTCLNYFQVKNLDAIKEKIASKESRDILNSLESSRFDYFKIMSLKYDNSMIETLSVKWRKFLLVKLTNQCSFTVASPVKETQAEADSLPVVDLYKPSNGMYVLNFGFAYALENGVKITMKRGNDCIDCYFCGHNNLCRGNYVACNKVLSDISKPCEFRNKLSEDECYNENVVFVRI